MAPYALGCDCRTRRRANRRAGDSAIGVPEPREHCYSGTWRMAGSREPALTGRWRPQSVTEPQSTAGLQTRADGGGGHLHEPQHAMPRPFPAGSDFRGTGNNSDIAPVLLGMRAALHEALYVP